MIIRPQKFARGRPRRGSPKVAEICQDHGLATTDPQPSNDDGDGYSANGCGARDDDAKDAGVNDPGRSMGLDGSPLTNRLNDELGGKATTLAKQAYRWC
ncbi:MAG TPA: hypothetical protein V6D46_10995 [Coleofasciculaceae cyanobacterium]